MFFDTYRKIAKTLEGSGLSKISFIRQTHKKLTKSLAPDIVEFDGFRLKHLGSLDQENKLFLKTLQDNIKVGDTVIDVGANIGYFTFYLSKLVGEFGHVYAFEPEELNFQILKENRTLNNFKNITIEQKAVSDKDGFTFLELSEDTGQHRISVGGGAKVESITLDNYFKDQTINFIKLDAERHERKILSGMKKILQNNDLKMITEFYFRLLDDPRDYFEQLEQRFR